MWKSFSTLKKSQRRFLIAWSLLVAALSAAAIVFCVRQQTENLKASLLRNDARMAAGPAEGDGTTIAERTPPAGHEKDVPDSVDVGIYVDRVYDLSLVGSVWKADFYAWFTWTDPKLNPGETFQVVNGEILSRTLLKKKESGRRRYALYRVMAQITKSFDTARFPRDDHMLNLILEDTASQSYQLAYTADPHSDVSSRVKVPGYEILQKSIAIKPHSYKTSRGDPELPSSYKATYSQFIYGIWIARPTWGLYFKMFQVLYASALIALLALFLKANDSSRLGGLIVGSFFAAVANAYVISTLIPDTGVSTLADVVNGIGTALIGLATIQSVISLYIFENQGDENFSRAFDLVNFFLLSAVYIVINIAIPLAASL
jgi:hypothetical protein